MVSGNWLAFRIVALDIEELTVTIGDDLSYTATRIKMSRHADDPVPEHNLVRQVETVGTVLAYDPTLLITVEAILADPDAAVGVVPRAEGGGLEKIWLWQSVFVRSVQELLLCQWLEPVEGDNYSGMRCDAARQ